MSPSRSSTASCAPVEAPEGTAARPSEPSSRMTSTSTVGLPRLSRISRPMMSTIAVMGVPVLFREVGGVLQDGPRAEKGADKAVECDGQLQYAPLGASHELCRKGPATGRRAQVSGRHSLDHL